MRAYSRKKYEFNGIGERFGKWEQVGPSFRIPGLRFRVAVLQCTCGEVEVREFARLRGRNGGCVKCCSRGGKPNPDADSHKNEYRILSHMISRCHNENDANFQRYGGRGIRVCDEWRARGGFAAFYAHVGPRPAAGWEIDRIDNNGNYEPGNVRWITKADNSRNRRTNVRLTFDGRTMLAGEWEKEPGAAVKHTILLRLRRGWSPERAIFGKKYKRQPQGV